MAAVGIDLEQFIRDPYATGIQRVLQQLALNWPRDVEADWVIPSDDGWYLLLDSSRAADLLSIPFTSQDGEEIRQSVSRTLAELRADREVPRVRLGQLVSLYDGWLLPEVSYLPSVLERLDIFTRSMPVTMVGYDALPMTHPQNYRFVPGVGANVSEYFRRLATVDAVVCISEYSRSVILDRVRRSRVLRTTVSHPGGDHLPMRRPAQHSAPAPVRFLRVGTMEARKRPLEILRGFLSAHAAGVDAELMFIGNANASSQELNDEVELAIASGAPVTWVRDASDSQVQTLMADADVFLSIGTEGYGIPVLEAIRLGTPVLYSGIQPAGELMAGRGATAIDAGSEESIARALREYGTPEAVSSLRSLLDPAGVPSWRSFATQVALEARRD